MTEKLVSNRDVVEHSVEAFVAEIVALTLDGWAVSSTCPGDAVGYGNTYTVSMYRDEDTVEEFRSKSVNIGEKPRLTRAEITAKAREALAVKRAAAKLDLDTVL